MKKYISEFIGTAVLVMIGCGTAMAVGCDPFAGSGYMLTALAFGIALIMMAYSIGNISGCHINPAVSIGMYISGRMSEKDLIRYIAAQVLGGGCGAAIIATFFVAAGIKDQTGAFGANGLAGVNGYWFAGLLIEFILTFVFVLLILGVTDEDYEHKNIAGLIIGIALTGVHIIGIKFTGTSVNPARSIGPAIFAAVTGHLDALASLWVFILGPVAGGAVAGVVYYYLSKNSSYDELIDELLEDDEEDEDEFDEEDFDDFDEETCEDTDEDIDIDDDIYVKNVVKRQPEESHYQKYIKERNRAYATDDPEEVVLGGAEKAVRKGKEAIKDIDDEIYVKNVRRYDVSSAVEKEEDAKKPKKKN